MSDCDQRLIDIGGHSLNIAISGRRDGPWLTCLHTLATDMRLWEGQREAFEADFRLLRIDLRGHGGSSSDGAPATIADYAADIGAVWDELAIERSAVIGLSIGGMIGLELALSLPERVSRLVAADCRADAPDAFRAMWGERRALLAGQGKTALADATLASWFPPETLAEIPSWLNDVRAMILATSDAGYGVATGALEQLDIAPRLPAMAVPVRYVVGSRDGVHPQAMRGMAAATPGAKLVEIAGSGHLPAIDRPQAFLAATLDFLRGRNDAPRMGPPRTMTPQQQEVADAIANGPRGKVEGPLGVWLNSAGLADRAQSLGAFCRYGTQLPLRLSELAIITIGAWWRSGFEWHVHAPIAREAGIDADQIERIRIGEAAAFERSDEAAVHAFTRELLDTRQVGDATYATALAELGETAVVELVGIIGYYTLISATINVFRVPVPSGHPEPFGDLA